MEKFCRFELHEYMDMYPQEKVVTFKGETEEEIVSNAQKWASDMTKNYSGGPTRFIKVMSAEEAKVHIDKQIAYEHNHWQDDSEDWIEELNRLYNKCYGES